MKIVVAATGFVGLTHAAGRAENGHEVHAYDIDLAKIESGKLTRRRTEKGEVNHKENP